MSLTHYRSLAPSSDTDYDYEREIDQTESVLGSAISLRDIDNQVPMDFDEPDLIENDLVAPAGSSSPSSPEYGNRGWFGRDAVGAKGKGAREGLDGKRKRQRESSVEVIDGDFSEVDTRGKKKMPRRGETKSIIAITQGFGQLGSPDSPSSDSSSESDGENSYNRLPRPEDTPCPSGDPRLRRCLVDKNGKNRKSTGSFKSRFSDKEFVIQTDPTYYLPVVRGYNEWVQIPVYEQYPGDHYIKVHQQFIKYTRPAPRRPALQSFPQRTPGADGVKHLQRRSPTSLLPRREKDTTRFVREHSKAHPVTGHKNLLTLRAQHQYQIRRRNLVKDRDDIESITTRNLIRWKETLQSQLLGHVAGTVKTGQQIRQDILDARVKRRLRIVAIRAYYARRKWVKDWELPGWARAVGPIIIKPDVANDDDEQEEEEVVLSTLAPPTSDGFVITSPMQVDEAASEDQESHDISEEVEMMEEEYTSSAASETDSELDDIEIQSTSSSSSDSTERESSPPPEYVPPISLPISPNTRARITSQSRLPNYDFNQYSNRSPSPPPPYNARTDCQPVFVDDEDEEEALMARIRPGEVRSPSPEEEEGEGEGEGVRRMVGAFPESVGASGSGSGSGGWGGRGGVESRMAWERALEVEEADEYNLDEAIQRAEEREYEARMREGQGALGSLARWIGGIWRR